MTKKEIQNEYKKFVEENKVIFDKYDWEAMDNVTISFYKWNSGKIRYIQNYFNMMLNNWNFDDAERLLNTKTINNAMKVVEYYSNDCYNSFTWPDGENKVSFSEQE